MWELEPTEPLDGLIVPTAISQSDDEIIIQDAGVLAAFTLPMPIVIGDEPMTVLSIDFNTNELSVERPFRRSHSQHAKLAIANEWSDQFVISDARRFEGLTFPLEMVLAVYEQQPDYVSDDYTFHDQITPQDVLTDLAAEGWSPSSRLANSEYVAATGNSIGHRAVDPEVVAMERVTVTDLDPERGIISVQRGRDGTTPIRFTSDAHLWAIPGQTNIVGSTFSGNTIVPYYYSENNSINGWDDLVFDYTQSIVRSEVTDFAPATVIQNSTFAANGSTGSVASIWTNRTSMFAGVNPSRYAMTQTHVSDDDPASHFEASGLVPLQTDSLILDGSILVDGHYLQRDSASSFQPLGIQSHQTMQLPTSQRYRNFIDSVDASNQRPEGGPRPTDDQSDPHSADGSHATSGGSATMTSGQYEDATSGGMESGFVAGVYNQSKVPLGRTVPPLVQLIVDDHADHFVSSIPIPPTPGLGFGADHTEVRGQSANVEFRWTFDQLQVGEYEFAVSSTTQADAPVQFEVVDTLTGDVLKQSTFVGSTDWLETRGRTRWDPIYQTRWVLLDDRLIIGHDANRGVEVRVVVPAGVTATIDAVSLRQWSHFDGSGPAGTQSGAQDDEDQSGQSSDYADQSNDPPADGPPPVVEELPDLNLRATRFVHCQSEADIEYLGTRGTQSRWRISSIAPGQYYLLSSIDGTAIEQPGQDLGAGARTVFKDSLTGNSWWLMEQFDSSASEVLVSLHAPAEPMGPGDLCVASLSPDGRLAAPPRFAPTGLSQNALATSPADQPNPGHRRVIIDDADGGFWTTQPDAIHWPTGFAGQSTIVSAPHDAVWSSDELPAGFYTVSSLLPTENLDQHFTFEVSQQNRVLVSGVIDWQDGNVVDRGDFDHPLNSFFEQTFHDNLYSNQSILNRFGDVANGHQSTTGEPREVAPDDHWLPLDRLRLDAGEVTVTLRGQGGPLVADAIRLERFAGLQPNLMPLAELGVTAAGHVPAPDSAVIDQDQFNAFLGLHGELAEPLPASYEPTWIELVDATAFVRSESNLGAPAFPYSMLIGAEWVTVENHRDADNRLLIRRGQKGSSPSVHPAGTRVVQGFGGIRSKGLTLINPGADRVVVQALPGSIPPTPFPIQIGDQRRRVSGVVDGFDGTWTLSLQTALSTDAAFPPSTPVLFLTDQVGASRLIDGNHLGSNFPDLGSIESFHATVSTFHDGVDSDPGDGFLGGGATPLSLRAAVLEANAFGGRAIINLPAGD